MKNNQKRKKELQAKVDREKKQLAEVERERNTIEERLNSTRRLDELEDDESRLKRLNEEDQAVIDDVYTSEFDKDAARERMAARDEDLLRLKAQISERESSLSLRERIKLIFKKYLQQPLLSILSPHFFNIKNNPGAGLLTLHTRAC